MILKTLNTLKSIRNNLKAGKDISREELISVLDILIVQKEIEFNGFAKALKLIESAPKQE